MMDGFKVETTELAMSSSGYYKASDALSDDLVELIGLEANLAGQTIGDQVFELLNLARKNLSDAISESRLEGSKCRQVANTYDVTERKVGSLVKSLPTKSPFLETSSPIPFITEPTNLQHRAAAVLQPLNVKSKYIPTRPVLMSGNRLPSESWLLGLAAKAIAEGEWQWK